MDDGVPFLGLIELDLLILFFFWKFGGILRKGTISYAENLVTISKNVEQQIPMD